MIESLQKIVPWLPTLPITVKLALTVLVLAFALLSSAVIWTSTMSDKVERFRNELSEIQATQSSNTRDIQIENLSERVVAVIETKYPKQAQVILDAKKQAVSTSELAKTVDLQLSIIKELTTQ